MSLHRVEQLRLDFNAHDDRYRLLSIVSPTCRDCRAGLGLVRDATADADEVLRFVLWIAMLAGDSADAAIEVAEVSEGDGRVRNYWEGRGCPA